MSEEILEQFPPLSQKILPVAPDRGGHVGTGKTLGQDLQK